MILNYSKLLIISFTSFLIFFMSSCDKEDLGDGTELFNPDFKDIQLKSGFSNNAISINSTQWTVNYIKDAVSGEVLQDKDGKPLVLDAFGDVELPGGWLKLEKIEEDNLLNVSLKENFDTQARKFLIGILADGTQDEISFTQSRGIGYKLVKKEIIEIPGSRKEYTSDEGCHTIKLTNHTAVAKNMETAGIFKDVNYLSEFSSDEYGAFDWVNSSDSLIFMGEILKDDIAYWSRQVPYRSGQYLEPFVKTVNMEQLLVAPYSSVHVSGEITYLTRECHYTFTIENLSSGYRFDISGTWKQKVPMTSITRVF
ncbi:hypothetical protein [Sphingobacterium faecium]|uniref:hypothetical protein n=1 Tax=Sphingobacterium faecium TaxID=34087 RepID=UPI0024685310|nr:hypothetical protein [Sphingobacterium faecium]MDH5825627.1 hypothetical protein [Sphingobacterium faecium]